MSIINTGIYYPTSFGTLSGGYTVSNIGVSANITVFISTPLIIKPSSGTAVNLTGLSSVSGSPIVTVEGLGETGVIVDGKPLSASGAVGSFFISSGYGELSASKGQSSIQPVTFSTDEEVVITPAADGQGFTFTYNEVILT